MVLTLDPATIAKIWTQFESRIVPYLDVEDDLELWSTVIGHVIADAEFLCEQSPDSSRVFVEIGRCSNWLRPHQATWPADGGFAWPSGYGGSGLRLFGLPEFKSSLFWKWAAEDSSWQPAEKSSGKRPLQLRMAIPARTKRHDQAAVHVRWNPGSPTTPKQKVLQFYGFRKQTAGWALTAHFCSNDDVYQGQTRGTKT